MKAKVFKTFNEYMIFFVLQNNDESTILHERPALRLDSRLVCKYEVLAIIGKGSFSQVLRVRHRITNQFYAVKLVSVSTGMFLFLSIKVLNIFE